MEFMKIARFQLDPRDERSDGEWYEVVGNDEGVFGYMSLMGCEDFCPKDLPHQNKIAEIRRRMIGAALRGK
jgi:fumarate reductase iron-sulfur subunit